MEFKPDLAQIVQDCPRTASCFKEMLRYYWAIESIVRELTTFSWGAEQQYPFSILMNKLEFPTTLAYPLATKIFTLDKI